MTAAQPTSSPADPPLSRASPLPQGIGGGAGSCGQPKSVWERACSRRRRHSQHHQLADPPLSRASSLPQGIGGVTGSCAHPGTKTVGASLLAMATAQPTSSPADPPLSRAGSLPQGIGGVTGSCCQPKSVWERACSRWRQHSQYHRQLTHRFREQARSHKVYLNITCTFPIASSANPCRKSRKPDGVWASVWSAMMVQVARQRFSARGSTRIAAHRLSMPRVL